MLLRLFNTYIADLLPKHQEILGSNIVMRNESFSPLHGLIGRGQDEEGLSNVLSSDETEVVAVVGMAGVGKTALISEVCRPDKNKAGFDYHLWVHVSQNFDPERIFRDLMISLSEKLHGEDLQSYWWSMKEGLVEKKYLVVLDDVWNEDKRKWDQLLHLLHGKKTLGNKIIVSTRIPAAGAALECATTYNLRPLSIKDSLNLLDTSGSGSVTRKIAKRCSGLPKLVYLMNSFLRKYKNQRAAMNAIEEFDKQCVDNNDLLHIAEASYNHLPSHLQRCFLYCSLFPIDHIFDAEEMTALWVAEGLTQVSSKEALVDADFSKLLDECFVICSESGSAEKMRYKMQFLLHNFARNLAKKRGYESIKNQNYSSPRTQPIRYVSLVVDRRTELPRSLIEQKDLRTLILLRKQDMILRCQRSEIREIPSDYCRYLTALRVLDLHATRINKLPDTFDMLSNLRYLNLSQTDITKLPESFGKLQYLIYLNIAQTCIAEVPESIGNIKSLRYLNLSQTGIRKLPNTIGELRSLQTLRLSHCKKLVKLSQNIASLTNLQKLDLEGCHYLTDMPPDISSIKNLKELNILECSSLDRMPNGLSALIQIEALPRYIATSGNSNSIELQDLRNLKRLGLENIGKISINEAANIQLQNKDKLEHLTLHCNTDDESSSPRVVEELLDHLDPSCLESNCRLRRLEIICYAGKQFPSWMSNKASKFVNLSHIRLVNLKCKSLTALRQLRNLTTLDISGMDAINLLDVELDGEPNDGQSKTFPALKKLTFTQMINLESWPANGVICDHLEELSIIQCPKFRKLSMHLPVVEKLTVCMSNHELFAEGGLVGVVDNLKGLSISLCGELSSSSKIEGLMELSKLEKLEISGCDKLENFPPDLEKLALLKSLSVIGCSGLRDLSCLLKCTSLRSLHISGCPMVTSLPIPPSLEKVGISGCDKLVKITGMKTSPLNRVSITECSRLPDLSYLEKCTSLRSLRIPECLMGSVPKKLREITTWE